MTFAALTFFSLGDPRPSLYRIVLYPAAFLTDTACDQYTLTEYLNGLKMCLVGQRFAMDCTFARLCPLVRSFATLP